MTLGADPDRSAGEAAAAAPLLEIVAPPGGGQDPWPGADALARMAEAEDALRAISAGEVDAFVVSDGGPGRQLFTLSTADRPYRMFVEHMRDGAATLSPQGVVLYANHRLADLLGCTRESIVGSPIAAHVTASAEQLTGLRSADEGGLTLELELQRADGVVVPVLVGSSPLDVDGDLLTCLTFADLSVQKAQDREIARLGAAQSARVLELQDAQAALTKLATHDALTGLPNRELLVDRIDQALAHAQRSGRSTAVIFLDLDRFKLINDTLGHAAGDIVLRRVADRLTAAMRPMDTVARIGGDEFVVLAVEVDSHLHAVDIGMRLVGEMARGHGIVGEHDRVGSSAGIAVAIAGAGDAESMLHEADTAMYRAKSLGGGRAEIFDAALGRAVLAQATTRRMLEAALDDRRVVVHYQPVIDLGTGGVVGFEALARILDPDGVVLPPIAFIPVAEETGLVVPLGAQVLGMACAEAARWRGSDGRTMRVAVNLSARQFEPGDLVEVVRQALAHTGLPPANLHLELTETAIIDLRADLLEQLAGIRALGVQLGLDDFGTGYASLVHLRRLPLSFVKIDQSFVQGLGTDSDDEQIVAAVVDLAANLDLRSIAEGVETRSQLDRLRALGCIEAQGYLFARPLVVADVAAAIAHPPW